MMDSSIPRTCRQRFRRRASTHWSFVKKRVLSAVAVTASLSLIATAHCFVSSPEIGRVPFRRTRTSAQQSLFKTLLSVSLKNCVSFQTLKDATRNLLDRSEIGSWDAKSFEDAQEIMDALSRRQSRRSGIMVERLLRRIVMEQIANNPDADGLDMTELYTTLIEAWAYSNEPERAEEILDFMQTTYEKGDSVDPLLCGPPLRAFNAILLAYARLGRSDAPQQAMRFLSKLFEWHTSGRTDVSPNKESYAAVLKAFAKTSDSPEVVRRLLAHMDKLSIAYPSVKPDYNCHNAYIAALLEAIDRRHISGPEGAKLADEYLRMMLSSSDEDARPDTWSFNMVLTAWSKSGAIDSAERAESLLEELETYHKHSGHSEKTRPCANSYNILIACYARSKLKDRASRAHSILRKMKMLSEKDNPSAKPDVVTYSSVMNAYAKSGLKEAPKVVEELFRELNSEYERNDRDPKLKPNSRTFNVVLDAWAKSRLPGAPERIMDLIKQMHTDAQLKRTSILPDKWAYSAYLQALSKSDRGPSIADEAERVLEEMESLDRRDRWNDECRDKTRNVKPDVLVYTNAIHCVAVSGHEHAFERANELLNRMEESHANGNEGIRPNRFTYNCVINAAAKSKRPGKAQLALQILRRMQTVALAPQTASFNNVLNACAYSDPRDDPKTIMQIAFDVLREAQEGPGANYITYQTVLRVICGLEHDNQERYRLTQDILRQCTKDGHCTRTVLNQVRFAVSPRQYSQLKKDIIDNRTGQIRDEFSANARRLSATREVRGVPSLCN